MSNLRRLLHEPAIHFVLLGAALFLAHRLVAPPEPAPVPPPGVIEVDEPLVDDLVEDWRQRHGREATATEREAIIDTWIRDEALFREALRLGLERSDPRVRQRLVQIMELVIDDGRDATPPDDATLEAWMRDNAALYTEPARLTLEHVDADRVSLDALRAGALPDGIDLDRLDDVSRTALGAQLGQSLADTAFAAEPGAWLGPLESADGPRFVRVIERTPGGLPPLEAVRDRVLTDWLQETRREGRAEAIDALLERRYQVRRLDAPEPPR